jgi:hypothetical protein
MKIIRAWAAQTLGIGYQVFDHNVDTDPIVPKPSHQEKIVARAVQLSKARKLLGNERVRK